MSGEDPSGKPIKLTLGSWEGRAAVLSEPLMEPGVYLLHDPQQPGPIRYAVSVAPTESALMPVTDREVAQAFEGGFSLFHDPAQIAANLDPARRQSLELWKWCLFAALGLMFVEGWMTRREAPGQGDSPGSGAKGPKPTERA
jgi:hypothetical protein